MNKSVLTRFSPQVLSGAESLGYDAKALSSLLGASEAHIARIACGLSTLNARHGTVLERKTGRGVGELAILGIEREASPAQRAQHGKLIRDTLELMTVFRPDSKKPSSRPRPRRTSQNGKRRRGTRARAA